jgi:putative SbcD/Mre11-related phosphoesterase
VNLDPVPDVPALVIRGRRRWACVADLHIGVEAELRKAGFNIPTQMPRILQSLEELASHADRLLVLGDVKHRVTHASAREQREVGETMGRAMDVFKAVVVTPGNHDGGLSQVMPEGCVVTPASGTVVEGVGAFHGHVWPSERIMSGKSLLMAHIHPSVLLEDSLGGRSNEKCWVRAPLDREKVLARYGSCPGQVVVVPALNPIITGSPVNTEGGAMLGPLMKNGMVDTGSMSVYLLDGTNLGRPAKVERRRHRA